MKQMKQTNCRMTSYPTWNCLKNKSGQAPQGHKIQNIFHFIYWSIYSFLLNQNDVRILQFPGSFCLCPPQPRPPPPTPPHLIITRENLWGTKAAFYIFERSYDRGGEGTYEICKKEKAVIFWPTLVATCWYDQYRNFHDVTILFGPSIRSQISNICSHSRRTFNFRELNQNSAPVVCSPTVNKCTLSKWSVHKYSFFLRTIPVWNGLPSSVIHASSVNHFKVSFVLN